MLVCVKKFFPVEIFRLQTGNVCELLRIWVGR
jgi:hypothetical protein